MNDYSYLAAMDKISILIACAEFLVGAVCASFIALVADRWPVGEDIVAARSHCRACKSRLPPRDLMPILSFVWLGGRCRACAAPIPAHLLATELAGGAIALLLANQGASGAELVAVAGWCAALLLLALLDARHFWLPDALTLPLGAAGLLLAAAGIGPGPSLGARLAGAGCGFIALELLRRGYRAFRGREGLGGGDPKLLGAIGAWTGLLALPAIVLAAAGLGLAWAAAMALRGRPAGGEAPIPLGTMLALAAIGWTLLVR